MTPAGGDDTAAETPWVCPRDHAGGVEALLAFTSDGPIPLWRCQGLTPAGRPCPYAARGAVTDEKENTDG